MSKESNIKVDFPFNDSSVNSSEKPDQKHKQRQKQREKHKEKQMQKQNESENEKKVESESEPNQIVKSSNRSESKKEAHKPKRNRNKKVQKEDSPAVPTTTTTIAIKSELPVDPEALKKLKKKQKRQLQKQRKKELAKTNGKQAPLPAPELPVFKITVRKLPPKLSQQSFTSQLYLEYPEFEECITEIYYVNGYLPESQFEQRIPSRCYINCSNEQTMMIVGRGIKGMIFKNDTVCVNNILKSDNNESSNTSNTSNDNDQSEMYDEDLETYTPIIEKSVYQKMPRLNTEDGGIKVDKWDFFNNKLEDIAIYQRFCEIISDPDRTQLPHDIFEYEKEYELKKKEEELRIKNSTLKKKKKKNKNKNKNKSKTDKVLTPSEQAKHDEIQQKKKDKKRRKRDRQRQRKLEESKNAKE